MDRVLVVMVILIAACRVGGSDGDADAWSTDADVEVDADFARCSYEVVCAGVECSRAGVCTVDQMSCEPACWCQVGYHAEGRECVPD